MLVSQQTHGVSQGSPNAGFVRSLWLLRTSAVVAVLDPKQLPVAGKPMTVSKGGLLAKVGALLTRLVLPSRTATFAETLTTDRSGTGYALTLAMPMPKPCAELSDWLYQNQGGRWVAFWQDGNGQGWVAGEPANGLRLATTQTQGTQNSITLTLTGLSRHPVWRLESTDPAELFPDAAFDYSFDLSFDA